MEFDVVIVGAGPSGLAAACRLMQLAEAQGRELTVCLVEKGSEVGAHILSGAIFEPRPLEELFPDWRERGAPLNTPVTHDDVYYLLNSKRHVPVPSFFVPKATHNDGNYAVSLGNLCRWLAEQAEAMGVNIFTGFAASEVLYNDDGSVRGVATGDMGVGGDGQPKPNFEPGYELHAKYTIFAEGCRGNLAKQLFRRHALEDESATQHYAIGLKELWDIDPERHVPGKVIHTVGWPLGHGRDTTGGSFLYHVDNNQVALGLIVDLSYSNPYLSPFDELQRLKTHPLIRQFLDGGKRVSYGARAIVKGGLTALPKITLPGALLVGDDAGFLNYLKIKGSHTAMKSGMLAAESVYDAIKNGSEGTEDLTSYSEAFRESWLYDELHRARNTGPLLHRLGTFFGAAATWLDQTLFGGKLPYTLSDPVPDHATLKDKSSARPIAYPRADNVITFDMLSSVFLSNTNHEEDQPCHLTLADPEVPIRDNLPRFDEPAQRYCPAGVYEVIEENGEPRFQINAQNCVHCKTCDIKDPAQNITWVVPEGTGGPNYPNM